MAAPIDVVAYSDALVVLGTAGVVVPMVRRFGLSPVLGYLGAGAVLGPLALGSLSDRVPLLFWVTVTDARNVSAIADLGVVFLLFLIGLELSYERLMTMRRLVFGLGSLQVGLTSFAIAGVLSLLGVAPAVALIAGVCLALSSTAIVLEVLSGQGRLASGVGRTSFSVLLAQDLAVVPVLLLIGILGASSGSIFTGLATALAKAALALIVIVVVGRLLLRPLFRIVAESRARELFVAAILFVIVASGLAAAKAGMSMALGAFVAGLLLAETEYRKLIESTIEPFKGLLLGLFFFTVGMSIDLGEIARQPLLVLGAVVGLVVLKSLLMLALARLYRIGWPVAIESALLLGPAGEFALVGIGMAATLGLFAPGAASFAIAVTSLSMAMIPMMPALAGWINRRAFAAPAVTAVAAELAAAPAPEKANVIIVGHGRVGQVVSDMLQRHNIAHLSIESDPAIVTEQRRRGHHVYYGDAQDGEFLNICGLADAAAVIVTVRSRARIDAVIGRVRELRPDVVLISRAQDAGHARHLYAIGVTDAVPETVEASLQLSEAALVGIGVPTGPVIASIHEKRDEFRRDLQQASGTGRSASRAVRSKRP